MRKIYLDTTHTTMNIGMFVKDMEVIPAGTLVNAMPVKHRNSEYQRFAKEYDIQFIFEDNIPRIDFYTVPMVDIFAVDSVGGYIGSVGQPTDLDAEIPICYIDSEKRCYLIAANGHEFLSKVHQWKKHLSAYTGIEFYESFEKAQKTYKFIDRTELEQKLKDVELQIKIPSTGKRN